ncbi:MAG TPA: hypothetical protein VFJ16_12035 [Longimicrobium sp.]|nr:hypothetical protein [Longimicrobium sp.]
MEPRESDSPGEPDRTEPASADAPRGDVPAQPPVRPEPPRVTDDEMGGEAPCQLHQFWDVEE